MKRPFNSHIAGILSMSLVTCCCIFSTAKGQEAFKPIDTLPRKVVVAGSEYSRSGLHNWLWGKHYRPEWVTPIKVDLVNLDTMAGGLKPYQPGGGRQSKTLRLRNPDSKEYVMRSVNKSFGKALPEEFRGTFVEKHVNDQVSIAHPYSAITIPPMAKAAGIYHTEPIIRFVPKQPALDSFNNEFGDNLYIIEQRPDENWEEADNLANSTNIISTPKLLAKLLDDNDNLVNQEQYVKARLFDMFIGDWGRHEDQWRWAKTEQNGKNVYQPIPRDRDQAYTKFEGTLLRIVISSAGLKHMEGFNENIKDVRTFNFPARYLDRRMANSASLEVWTNAAKELQAALTDEVIELSIRLLPPEVYNVSGAEITSKLKARRGHLVEFATDYYKFLAEEVDIPGTEKHEHFVIHRINENETKVSIYKIKKSGEVETTPAFERVFNRNETREIRLYGIAGNDIWDIKGDVGNNIMIRVIGGKDKDVINDMSRNAITHIYDNKGDNDIVKARGTRLHLSKNDTIHSYRYDAFKYDRKVFRPILFFSNYDKFYVGVSYNITNQAWRKDPFASRHSVYARYSITQNAFSVGYQAIKERMFGNWDLYFNVDYDAIRWTNYFGIGNETVELPKDMDYYRVRSREMYAGIGLNRQIGQSNNLRLTPFFQSTRIINDPDRLLSDNINAQVNPDGTSTYKWDNYAGVALNYNFADVDDAITPTRGLTFGFGTAYTRSLETVRSINSYTGNLNFYVPLSRHLVLAVKNAGATVTGDPKFYQLNAIGGSQNLRGYRRDRFRGRTTFYNNTELQYLFDFKSYLFNGKAGFVGFYDIGRVWHPNESSSQWHSGYGAGVTIAPFNKAMFSVTYGISKENKLVHLRLSRVL